MEGTDTKEHQSESTVEEIEINFQLDPDGRIALLSSSSSSSNVGRQEEDSNNGTNEDKAKDVTESSSNSSLLNYDTQVLQTQLRFLNNHPVLSTVTETRDETKQQSTTNEEPTSTSNNEKQYTDDENDSTLMIWDEIYYDCEISDSGLMPRTYWIGSNDVPRCSLEQFAYDIFQYHTRSVQPNVHYDPIKSGAEWWVQIRPSPEKIGRYSMHNNQQRKQHDDATTTTSDNPNNSTNENTTIPNESKIDMSIDGISFHWDKDEDLRILCGGNTYIHPHLSTVTYLTSVGSPTLVLNKRINNFTGEWIENNDTSNDGSHKIEGFLSYPYQFKHLVFDGRYLHAAPHDLLLNGNKCTDYKVDDNEQSRSIKEIRRNRRITFLVNVWINYIPLNTKPFPNTMIDKLSGYKIATDESTDTVNNTPDYTKARYQRVGLSFLQDNNNEKKRKRVSEEENNTNGRKNESQPVSPPFRIHESLVECIPDSKTSVGNDNVGTDGHHEKHNKFDIDQVINKQNATEKLSIKRFVWPMGDCDSDEYVQADIPIQDVDDVSNVQGNIRIVWEQPNNTTTSTIETQATTTNQNPTGLYLLRTSVNELK